MRNIFVKILLKNNKKKRVYLIVNDLGFNVVEPFIKKYKNNFVNAGISEQNMVGLAAGIASENNHVFVYSIANFSTFRCAEQIRNDVDYHKLNVTLVSVGSGLGYGNLGYTHHALQDYSLMRSLPNMMIISPGNEMEVKLSLEYILKNPTPSYLRLCKNQVKNIFKFNYKKITPGKIYKLKEGKKDKIILTTGSVQNLIKEVNLNKNYSVYSLPIWGTKTNKTTFKILKNFKKIITIEDHFKSGGFGSWINELLSETDTKVSIRSINEKVITKVGSENFLMKKYGPAN